MPLQTKLGTKRLITPDGDKIVLQDATGNFGDISYVPSEEVEGEYSSISNTTGYGEVNGLRDSVANFIIGTYKATKADEPIVLEPYSVLTSEEYFVSALLDGHYKFNMITVPIIDDVNLLMLPEDGALFFDISQNKILKYVIDAWVELQPIDLKDTQYCSPTLEHFHVAHNTMKYNDLVRQVITLIRTNTNGVNKYEIQRVSELRDKVWSILTGAIYEFCRGNKINAQDDIEFLNTNVDNVC